MDEYMPPVIEAFKSFEERFGFTKTLARDAFGNEGRMDSRGDLAIVKTPAALPDANRVTTSLEDDAERDGTRSLQRAPVGETFKTGAPNRVPWYLRDRHRNAMEWYSLLVSE